MLTRAAMSNQLHISIGFPTAMGIDASHMYHAATSRKREIKKTKRLKLKIISSFLKISDKLELLLDWELLPIILRDSFIAYYSKCNPE